MGRLMMGNSYNGLVSLDLQVIIFFLFLNIIGNYNLVILYVIIFYYIIILFLYYRYLYFINIIGNYILLVLLVIIIFSYYW